jgi:hypothetical protein
MAAHNAGDGARQATPRSRGSALNGDTDLLRQLVREVLAEALPELAPPDPAPPGPLPPSPPTSDPAADPAPGETAHPSPEITIDPCIHQAGRGAGGALAGTGAALAGTGATLAGRGGALAGRGGAPARTEGALAGTLAASGPWTVRLSTDEELHAFVLRVLKLADNPRLRNDLISGRARFRLSAPPHGAAASVVRRVDKGAVTERAVTDAARAGARLVLGPRAVLTPLARDKARALGVPIEKER